MRILNDIFRIVSLFFFFSIAQAQGTQFELGVAKGSALKMGVILDQHELQCKKLSGNKWENLVDSAFRSTWGHGKEFILNGTASSMKMSLEDVKNYPIKEFNQAKKELGGCSSPKYKLYIENMYRDYQDTLQMIMDKPYWGMR